MVVEQTEQRAGAGDGVSTKNQQRAKKHGRGSNPGHGDVRMQRFNVVIAQEGTESDTRDRGSRCASQWIVACQCLWESSIEKH